MPFAKLSGAMEEPSTLDVEEVTGTDAVLVMEDAGQEAVLEVVEMEDFS